MSTAYFGLCNPTTGAISGDDGEDSITHGSLWDGSNTWAAPAGTTVTLTALEIWGHIDATETGRIGLYTSAGALVCDAGAFSLSGSSYAWKGVTGLSVALTPSASYKFLFTQTGAIGIFWWRYKTGASGVGQYDVTDRTGSALPGTLPTGTALAQQLGFRATVTVSVDAPTAALTGTATASITESDVVAGGKTIILTLTNDTFIA